MDGKNPLIFITMVCVFAGISAVLAGSFLSTDHSVAQLFSDLTHVDRQSKGHVIEMSGDEVQKAATNEEDEEVSDTSGTDEEEQGKSASNTDGAKADATASKSENEEDDASDTSASDEDAGGTNADDSDQASQDGNGPGDKWNPGDLGGDPGK
ncbi:MAG: hypothetical protein R3D05_20560 [Dongiaceae bacterium]